jgi:hypothetical protein
MLIFFKLLNPSRALEGDGSAGMRTQLQCLQLVQRAQGLQAAEAEVICQVFIPAVQL